MADSTTNIHASAPPATEHPGSVSPHGLNDDLDPVVDDSAALLTDLYQLTMAYGYWRSGVAERQAAFHLFYRKNPFRGGYAIACGLAQAIEHLRNFRFSDGDLSYLATLTGNDEARLFSDDFLEYLRAMRFQCDVSAIPEGTVVFPHEPLVRIVGPMIQCQLLETPLLTLINFQTLIATKAARICEAARGEPVMEFGLRRAQGADGGLSASRAAYIGGCVATSNVLAGKRHDIPVKGTHAHSWVMFFADERTAFSTYAEAMPNNCVFLVDTYDTLAGVHEAVAIGKELRARGHTMVGIRLDSGDLAYLSIEARKILDDGGFKDAAIVASNDLDEHVIKSLKEQGATIAVWGVGTKLATAADQPALGGVFKLAAVRTNDRTDDRTGDRTDGTWEYKIKLSETPIKISNPGVLQVRRYFRAGQMIADVIHDADSGIAEEASGHLHDIDDPTRTRPIGASDDHSDLLVPVFARGQQVYRAPDIHAIRAYARTQLDRLDPRSRRFLNPHYYPVGLDRTVHERKREMIAEARESVEIRARAHMASSQEPNQ